MVSARSKSKKRRKQREAVAGSFSSVCVPPTARRHERLRGGPNFSVYNREIPSSDVGAVPNQTADYCCVAALFVRAYPHGPSPTFPSTYHSIDHLARASIQVHMWERGFIIDTQSAKAQQSHILSFADAIKQVMTQRNESERLCSYKEGLNFWPHWHMCWKHAQAGIFGPSPKILVRFGSVWPRLHK